MNIFSIFKKKAPGKCTECLHPIEGRVWCLDDKKYCRECYNRKMAILQQTGVYHNGGNPVSEKQGGNTPSGRTFVCGICGKSFLSNTVTPEIRAQSVTRPSALPGANQRQIFRKRHILTM